MFGVGPLELIIVLFILLMLFGARRLPELGRSLGSGMREFKEGIVNPVDEFKEEFTSPVAEQKRSVPALPRPADVETAGAPKMRDAVSD
jgi:sec-independent protein translocase protein TatA